MAADRRDASRLSPEAPVLEVEGLRGGYDEVEVLRGVTFALMPHTVTTVIGPNGAGKSTLLRAIYGRLRLTAGAWLSVDLPAGYAAYSNMPIARSDPLPGGLQRVEFGMTPKMGSPKDDATIGVTRCPEPMSMAFTSPRPEGYSVTIRVLPSRDQSFGPQFDTGL